FFHERHNSQPVIGDTELAVGFIPVRGYLSNLSVRANAGRHGYSSLLKHLSPQPSHNISRIHLMVIAIVRNVQVCLINTSTLESGIIFCENGSNLLGFSCVFFKVKWETNQLRTK